MLKLNGSLLYHVVLIYCISNSIPCWPFLLYSPSYTPYNSYNKISFAFVLAFAFVTKYIYLAAAEVEIPQTVLVCPELLPVACNGIFFGPVELLSSSSDSLCSLHCIPLLFTVHRIFSFLQMHIRVICIDVGVVLWCGLFPFHFFLRWEQL